MTNLNQNICTGFSVACELIESVSSGLLESRFWSKVSDRMLMAYWEGSEQAVTALTTMLLAFCEQHFSCEFIQKIKIQII